MVEMMTMIETNVIIEHIVLKTVNTKVMVTMIAIIEDMAIKIV